jgi:uncharacterized protein YggE
MPAMTCHCYSLMFSALLLANALPASAQSAGEPPTVSGTGMAAIERAPETLRVEIDLLAKGKDLKDALSKLKQRRTAAEEQLAKLGADSESVRFGVPRVTASDSDPQKQMQVMIRQRITPRRGGRRPAEKPPIAPPVAVAMSLVAQWPLKSQRSGGAEGADQLLLAAHDLEQKIKQADLAGRQAAEELSPEEAELAEEAEEDDEQVYYGGQPQPKPGEPRFVYVSSISEADRAQALATAFQRAKADAKRLATAADADLGDLRQLSGGNESGADPETENEWASYAYQAFPRALRQPSAGQPLEAVGARPGMLKYHVSVSATFVIK